MPSQRTASPLLKSLVIAASISAPFAATASDQLIRVAVRTEISVLPDLLQEFQRDNEIEYPEDNLPNEARTRLGHTLFFDPRLSRSGSQSCATCHNPAFAWGDGLAVGVGENMEQLGRRSPTILNLAWSEPLMWDGRAESLEEQALGPIQAGVEMNMPLDDLVARLSKVAEYAPMFEAAFGSHEITAERIAMAIAAYERTIVSDMAPFDRWVEGDAQAVSESAKRGFELFAGKANCSTCHEGWRFTDDGFYDIGLEDDDVGRGALFPNIETLQYAFRTPGLRNINQRAPFMHDGSLPTLRAVVEHYNTGGIQRASLSDEIYPLNLNAQEIDDILAFLDTLTSEDSPVVIPVLPR